MDVLLVTVCDEENSGYIVISRHINVRIVNMKTKSFNVLQDRIDVALVTATGRAKAIWVVSQKIMNYVDPWSVLLRQISFVYVFCGAIDAMQNSERPKIFSEEIFKHSRHCSCSRIVGRYVVLLEGDCDDVRPNLNEVRKQIFEVKEILNEVSKIFVEARRGFRRRRCEFCSKRGRFSHFWEVGVEGLVSARDNESLSRSRNGWWREWNVFGLNQMNTTNHLDKSTSSGTIDLARWFLAENVGFSASQQRKCFFYSVMLPCESKLY